MGSQAELLSKKIGIKRIGVDSVLIWLVFSKVAYEFIHNYPYSLFSGFPYFDFIDYLDEAWINLLKNIGVLVFFLIILVALGFHQIKKYNLNEKKFKDKVDQEVKDLLSPVEFIEQVKKPLNEPESIDEYENDSLDSYQEEKPNSESTEENYSEDPNL